MRCPSRSRSTASAQTRSVWREWLDAEAATVTEIDASKVEHIDSAGVQLLVSLVREMRDQGGDVSLIEPSAALREACDAMGTSAWMNIAPVSIAK